MFTPPLDTCPTDDISAMLPFWHQLAHTLREQEDDNTHQPVVIQHQCIFRIRSTVPDGGSRSGEQWFLAPCLSLAEATALVAHLSQICLNLASLQPMPRNRLDILPTPLPDVLADAAACSALQQRLKSFTPYGGDTLPAGGEWVWFIQAQEHWNLWLHHGQLYLPSSWSVDHWGRRGPLESNERVFHVTNGHGLAGLADLSGKLLLPCRYRWLSDVSFYHHPQRRLEAQWPEDADDESDLIDLSGKRFNPPGIKLLAGTFDACAQAVVVQEGQGARGLKGLMNIEGQLLRGTNWRSVKALNEQRAAVQDDATGLWGYVDASGKLVIPCRYAAAHAFNDGRAIVALPQGQNLAEGLINTKGHFIIEPCWKSIDSLRHNHLVEDFEGRFGVFDGDGLVLLAPQTIPLDADDPTPEERERIIKRALQLALDSHPRQAEPRKRIAADPQHRLAGLGQFFNAHTNERDLRATGLWGMKVEINQNQQRNDTNFRAGDRGMIFWQYPITASLFDLSLEAPVMGLFGLDDQCLGVPWEWLKQVTKEGNHDNQ